MQWIYINTVSTLLVVQNIQWRIQNFISGGGGAASKRVWEVWNVPKEGKVENCLKLFVSRIIFNHPESL